MSLDLKEDILKAVRDAKIDRLLRTKKPKFKKYTISLRPKPNFGWQPTVLPQSSVPPMPPTTGSNAVKPKKPCTYETPCGWCTKWDKKCDKKPYKRGLRVEINPVDDALNSNPGLVLEKIKEN